MVPDSSPQNTVMCPWARRPKACLLLNVLSLVQIMLHLLNIEPNHCPCLVRADTPELNLSWSCLVGGRITWAEPALILTSCWSRLLSSSEADGSMTSSGSDLLDPTCNRVLPHAFSSRLSLTSLLHYSLLLPLLLPSLWFEPLHGRRVFLPSEGLALGLRVRV